MLRTCAWALAEIQVMASKRLQKNIRKMRFMQQGLVIVSEDLLMNIILLNEDLLEIIVWPDGTGNELPPIKIKINCYLTEHLKLNQCNNSLKHYNHFVG
jgi:hypothetical protein